MNNEDILLFQEATSDIKDLKSLEWKITYYVLILTGAILSITINFINQYFEIIKWLASILIFSINITGFFLMNDCSKTLIKYRKRLKAIAEKISDSYRSKDAFGEGYIKIYSSKKYHNLFKGTFIISAFFSILILIIH